MSHPCQYTPAIIDALRPIIADAGLPVHDPFAGTGIRLGQLCDEVGVPFTGTEIEPPFITDYRVDPGNSTMPLTYPARPFMVVTSPVYPNGMTDHQRWAPGLRWKWHTYRHGLARITGEDRPLHPDNMARYGNAHRRGAKSEAAHWDIAQRCIRHWPERVVVNVKDVVATNYRVPVVTEWSVMLALHDYRVVERIDVPCPGQRHGRNGDLRVDHESIIVAERP